MATVATDVSQMPPAYNGHTPQDEDDLPEYVYDQSPADDQITAVSGPLPPSYQTESSASPHLVFQAVLDAISQSPSTKDSDFRVPDELRDLPDAQTLHRQVLDKSEQPAEPYCLDPDNQPIRSYELLLAAFFHAIAQGLEEPVLQFLGADLVTANTPASGPEEGHTPLLCAIQHYQTHLIPCLLAHGADIDGFGLYHPVHEPTVEPASGEARNLVSQAAVRTPLQLAATLGQLSTVKNLRELHGADDSIIAPDGQTALRLASMNGHAEIVAYLPARRAGGYLRWKTKHYKSMKRVKKSFNKLVDAATQVVYHFPKTIIQGTWLAIRNTTLYCWRNKHRTLEGCKKLLVICWKIIKATPYIILTIAVGIWLLIRKSPGFIAKILVHLSTKTIPQIARFLYRVCKRTVLAIGGAFAWIANRIASFLHTIFSAIASAFRRITWTDIRNGFKDVLHAIFINFPRALWPMLKRTMHVLLKAFEVTFICVFSVLLLFFAVPYVAIEFILKHAWRIISSIGATLVEAGKEVHIWFNPKA